ncbi:MAG: sensor histidine kinase [Paraclostridium dentum]|uniref:histidine kinase n=1 Tax=Paraclostridium bifermentans TaxID=1490 RepID=A0AA44DN17_PARBF|nr:HAMP domain-containing sensor histidine kinase [Paraclostridium bifermentans]MBN8049157.1 HAMP domain-containing histidine kinase [Paraclostridium bifermentans]MCU9807323.1 HAMP domain-containing histidine kinase [Paraclostridium sp. AKS46]NME10744.1 HAMP domain-containing histidine kinase [Paraclostridium bifermentans]
MVLTEFFIIVSAVLLIVVFYLGSKLYRTKQQISVIQEAVTDIKDGNLNRKILTRENDMTRQICYDLNTITTGMQATLINQRQSEQAYKRLMTSLSHDVKTPLASLVGYLEAIEKNIVTGKEKEEYIEVAIGKAYSLKDFTERLFEWVKLDAGEQIFHFEVCDVNELSRSIAADWIIIIENNNFDYEIDIPETECFARIDVNSYTRILNNLFQNVISHSKGTKLIFDLYEDEKQVTVKVSDNGIGIQSDELSHIFERMYRGDKSRMTAGAGLGLSITKELVAIHNGTIEVESILKGSTTFTIILPKSL